MSVYVNSLISHVNSVKPFHTKILGVEVNYIFEEYANILMTEHLHIDIKLGLPFDTFDWDYTAIESGILPRNQLVDGLHVSMEEEFKIDSTYVEHPIDSPYLYNSNPWDTPHDGFQITSVVGDRLYVRGNVAAVFNAVPGMQFQITNSTQYNGSYYCDNASYDNVTDITTVIVVGGSLPAQVGNKSVQGYISLSLWDAIGWDGTNPPEDLPPASFSINSTFNESFFIQEGYGFDHESLNGWDNSSEGWDEGVYLIGGSSHEIEDAGLPDTKIVFAYNDVPNPHGMKLIHTQLTLSSTWTVNVADYYNPQVAVYDDTNQPIQWTNLSRPNNRTVVLTFATPRKGYVLGI